ncbi:hypothetical protein ANCDUO_15538, partial [Ancylostoma duodenale]
LDVLVPNFTNTYDVLDEKKQEKRAKRDRKALTQRVRRRIREELREAARRERSFRVTTFLDVSMFWTNIMWVYCLQWHLCCRLGFMRFWMWLALLSTVTMTPLLFSFRNRYGSDDCSDELRDERAGFELVPVYAKFYTGKISTQVVISTVRTIRFWSRAEEN